jgi:hypothetical protein
MIALKGVIVRDRASIVVEVEHNLGAKNDIAGWLSRGAMTSFCENAPNRDPAPHSHYPADFTAEMVTSEGSRSAPILTPH